MFFTQCIDFLYFWQIHLRKKKQPIFVKLKENNKKNNINTTKLIMYLDKNIKI